MKALVAVGHHVTVVSAGPGVIGHSVVDLEGIQHHVLTTGALTAPGRVLRFLRAAARYAVNLEPDVISCRDLDTLAAGIWVRRRWKELRRVKVVYDMHEVYSMMVKDAIPLFVARRLDAYERKLLPEVDLALPSDDGRRDWLVRQGYRGPAPVILNCRNPASSIFPFPGRPKILSYTGTLHTNRFIREMVEAMDHIDATLVIAGPDAEGGKWNKYLRDVASKNPRIQFLGHLTPAKSLEVLGRSHVSIQMADPENELNRMGPYNRLFDSMSVGRAVLATEGTANGNIVKGLRMGLTSIYDRAAYTAAVNLMLNETDQVFEMGLNGLKACLEKFNWDSQAKRLTEAYERL